MDLLTLTTGKVKDQSEKLQYPTDYQNAIAAALKRYSKHRSRILTADIPGDGTHDYALPAGWSPGLSAIQSVEFPAGLIPEVLLDSREYRLYQTPAGQTLRIPAMTPTAAEVIRVSYNGLHTEETVAETDLDAVACLAASICCTQLAAAYGQTSSPIMQADVVDYRSKTDEFRRLADFLERQYKEHLGIRPDDTVSAAMATAEPPAGPRTRLTHSYR